MHKQLSFICTAIRRAGCISLYLYKDCRVLNNKLISIAVLEHMKILESIIRRISEKLIDNDKFIVEIPAEGEFLWWLVWRLTTGIGF